MKIYDQFGTKKNVGDIAAADALLTLKRESGSNPWPVISKCINLWADKHPEKWNSYLFDLGKVKDTRLDKDFGQSKETVKHHGYSGVIRYTVDLPEPVYLMIRCVYDENELPMNKEFFREFVIRYPLFRVTKKT